MRLNCVNEPKKTGARSVVKCLKTHRYNQIKWAMFFQQWDKTCLKCPDDLLSACPSVFLSQSLLFSVFICHLTFMYSSLSLHQWFHQASLCIYLSVSLLPAWSQPTEYLSIFLSADIQSSCQATYLVSLLFCPFYLSYLSTVLSSILFLCFSVSLSLFFCQLTDYPNIFFHLPLLSVFLLADLSDYLAVYILSVSLLFYVLSLCLPFFFIWQLAS